MSRPGSVLRDRTGSLDDGSILALCLIEKSYSSWSWQIPHFNPTTSKTLLLHK